MFVQFSSSYEAEVMPYFSCAQDQEAWPNQCVVEPSDERYINITTAFHSGRPMGFLRPLGRNMINVTCLHCR